MGRGLPGPNTALALDAEPRCPLPPPPHTLVHPTSTALPCTVEKNFIYRVLPLARQVKPFIRNSSSSAHTALGGVWAIIMPPPL